MDKFVKDTAGDENEFLATRASLLSSLRQPGSESWREFFETYWRLIYSVARKKGLSDDEAREVVQETMIGVSRSIPHYVYDPAKCSFKTWLMRLVQWRIIDQVRKREHHEPLSSADEVECDPQFAGTWDEDWERNLIQAALERVKLRASPQEYQIFACCVLQQKGVAETARVLNVSRARIYLARHRVAGKVKTEIDLLRQENKEKP